MRQRQDAFSEFFKQYILEDSTEVADSTPDSRPAAMYSEPFVSAHSSTDWLPATRPVPKMGRYLALRTIWRVRRDCFQAIALA